MGRVYEFAIQLGSKLSSGFGKPFMSAAANIDRLDKNLKNLKDRQGKIDAFRSLKRDIHDTRLSFVQAQSDVTRLSQEMQRAEKPTRALQNRFNAAQRKAETLRGKLKGQRQELTQLRGTLSAAGLSTKGFRSEQEKLAKQIEKTTKVQKNLQAIQGMKQANLQHRAQLRGQMVDTMALASSIAAPIYAAAKAQEAEVRLSTVINAKDKESAMKEAASVARRLAKSGLTGLQEGYDIQYALNSAGLEAEAARVASLVVAKVAKVTSGAPEQVGEVIATTYNNLGQQLSGTTEEKMSRIGDLLTKVQFKYQIRDFGQLGDSLTEAASGMANYNVNVEQGVMLLGQLNSAGLQGGRAGTSFNAVLRQLGKAQKEWGIDIKRTESGELDMIATLEEIDRALDGLDTDERAQAIQDVMGDEGAKGLVPLLNKLAELPENLKDVSEGSKGIVDQEVLKFLDSAIGHFNKFKGTMTVLAVSLGNVLLPSLNNVLSPITKGAMLITNLAEKFPFVTKVILTTTAALIGLKVAAIAGGYAWTFIKGGALNAAGIFNNVRAAVLLLTGGQKALMASQLKGTAVAKGLALAQKAVAAAQRFFNAALSANPIAIAVIAVSGLIAAGIALYKNWDKVSKWFSGFWTFLKSGFKLLAEPMLAPFKLVFGWISGKLEWFKEKWNGLKKVLRLGSNAEGQKQEANLAWDVYSSVPGHAAGAITRLPHLAMVGEEGGESIIPHAPHRRKRAIDLWEKTGDILGVNSSGESVYVNFAPNITISGDGNVGADIEKAMKKACDDLMRRIESMRRDERRLNFS